MSSRYFHPDDLAKCPRHTREITVRDPGDRSRTAAFTDDFPILVLKHVVIKERPLVGSAHAVSNPHPVEFIITDVVPSWYVCLGFEYMDRHFDVDRIVVNYDKRLGREYVHGARFPGVYCAEPMDSAAWGPDI
jgi:hypothetical protein